MSTATMTAQEIERVTVATMASFDVPIFDPPAGVIGYAVNPSTGVSAALNSMSEGVHLIRRYGAIAYAVADVPDENGEETYWTIERVQRFFDHHRAHYVNGD